MRAWIVLLLALLIGGQGQAREKTPADRGKEALLGESFSPPLAGWRDYERLWRVWGLKEKPSDFDTRVRERYGLHEAPYPNHGLPMGLREARSLLGKGVGSDCLLCHGSSIAGQSIVGLGNASLDLQALFDELALAQGIKQSAPIPFSNVRGTTESSVSALYLSTFRNPDLTLRAPVKVEYPRAVCEDTPAWWLLKRKQTMYHVGSHSAQNVRSLMAFLLTPLNTGEYIKSKEPAFRDIRAYLLTLEAPRYPFAIDRKKAEVGQKVFEQNCARCHGTYGPEGKYPNKIVDIDAIGTDPVLATSFPQEAEDIYNRSWFGEDRGPDGQPLQARANRGYQAPPLDGVWATAPYFHNGSVPTVYHVLNSKARPKIFTRSYRTGKDDYDPRHLGWKITVLPRGADPALPPLEQRRIYDTSQRGRASTGHTYGDRLSEDERLAVIEYLKTL